MKFEDAERIATDPFNGVMLIVLSEEGFMELIETAGGHFLPASIALDHGEYTGFSSIVFCGLTFLRGATDQPVSSFTRDRSKGWSVEQEGGDHGETKRSDTDPA